MQHESDHRCQILIPIYNGFQQVRRCLESVLATVNAYCSIKILDDASSDLRLIAWLEEQEKLHPCLCIDRYETNLGFVGNLNRGLVGVTSDVIVLNSDTVVTRGWIEKLVACANSGENIGIVCPLSNNATILSVPEMNRNNAIPCGMNIKDFAALVESCSARIYPRLPVAVGFCMLIRLPVIKRIGLLHNAFHRGYGEECDLSLRAWEAGFEVVCCDDNFVYHEGEQSFGSMAGMGLIKQRNDAVLHARWPFYTQLIQRFCTSNPLLEVQERIKTAVCRARGDQAPHLLQVLHAYASLGGTELHSRHIVNGIADEFRTTILFPGTCENVYLDMEPIEHSDLVRVLKYRKENISVDRSIFGYVASLRNEIVENAFTRLVVGGEVKVVHFQHLLGWGSLELPLIAKALGATVILSLHDYYLFCPVFDLLLPTGRSCGKNCADPDDESCLACLSFYNSGADSNESLRRYLFERRQKLEQVFICCDLIISPSEYVRTRFAAAYGRGLAAKVCVVEHGLPDLGQHTKRTSGRRFRLGVFANMTHRKGAEVFIEAARRLKASTFVEIVHHGGAESRYQEALTEANVELRGRYRPETLRKLAANIDLAVVPSISDETFCLTVAELQSLGVPVIAFAVGAMTERIHNNETGFLVANVEADALAERIMELIGNQPRLDHVRRNLRMMHFKSIAENALEYAAIYRSFVQANVVAADSKTESFHSFPLENEGGGFVNSLLAALDPQWGRTRPGYGSSHYRQWLDVTQCLLTAGSESQKDAALSLDLLVIELERHRGELAETLTSLRSMQSQGVRIAVFSYFDQPQDFEHPFAAISWYKVPADTHFARSLNLWIAKQRSDWIALVRSGDRLNSTSGRVIAAYLKAYTDWRLIYSDEDSVAEDGRRYRELFKPDFNLDLLRSKNYIGDLTLMNRDAFIKCGGFAFFPFVAVYDICLKIADRCGEAAVGHIPHVLYHRCDRGLMLAPGTEESELMEKALVAHLQRAQTYGNVNKTGFPGVFWIDYSMRCQPRFTVIVVTSGDGLRVVEAIDNIRRFTADFDVIVVNFQRKGSIWSELKKRQRDVPIKSMRASSTKNIAGALSRAIEEAKTELICVTHDGIRVEAANSLTVLLGILSRRDVALVGPCILDASGRILHSYQVAGFWPFGATGQLHSGQALTPAGPMERNVCVNNCVSVSSNFFAIRKAAFKAVGGFDQRCFPEAWYLLDCALKLMRLGLKVVWTPHASVVEVDEGSFNRRRRKSLKEGRVAAEVASLYDQWLGELAHDKAYNPNLTLRDFSFQPETQIARRWDPLVNPGPRILGFPGDCSGSGHYRVIDPLSALEKAGLSCTSVVPRHDVARVPSVVEMARLAPTVMLLHNTLHDQHLHALELYRNYNDARLVLSLDDLITDLPLWNPFRETNYSDMNDRLNFALERCDCLLVSSGPLADAYAGRHDDIRVLPNRLPSARWCEVFIGVSSPRRPKVVPRIGWAGAQQHEADLNWLRPVVKALSQDAEWYFFGFCPDILKPYATGILPMVDFNQYPATLASLELDIAIAPLELHDFNRCKTNLKLLEYGILGTSVVCTDIEPYREAPVERLPNDPQRWTEALRARLYDLDASRAEGERLRKWVREGWLLEDGLEQWLDVLVRT